jgi:tRNA(fMet)-specific endonuclease VapC
MKFILDTNTCIRYISGRSPAVRNKLQRQHPADITLCAIVKAELFYGAMKSVNPGLTLAEQARFFNRFSSLAFDDVAARIFGEIRADLARKGTPIGPYDLQIAAIALANRLTLVTHNTREFSRVDGLNLEDWEIDG